MTFAEWCDLLGVKNGMAKCPAHDDTRDSLSVTEGREGCTLLKCHAGCLTEPIVAAVGRTMADLFPEHSRNGREIVETYDYTDERGTLLYQVVRFAPKAFAQRRPNGNGGWTWKLDGVRRVLYRLPELTAAIAAGRSVLVVEGEKDVETLRRVGKVATTNPSGAGKWRPEFSETLRGSKVMIVADRDEPGLAHAHAVAASLDGVAQQVLIRQPVEGCKDVTDHLAAGHTLAELVQVSDGLVADASESTPVEFPEVGETETPGRTQTPPPSRSLAEILKAPDVLKPPSPVVPGLAWAGRITLVAAREGVGKSTLFQALAAAVTTGGEFLGERCPQGVVLWVLVEEHLSDLVIRAVRFQTAPDVFYVLERPAEPLSTLRAEVERLKPILVIVDTLHRFATSLVTDGSAADQWGPLMTALDVIARHNNPAILMSAQAIKATGDYRDSTAIGHGVDVVLNLVRPEKDSPVRRLETQKARWPMADLQFELDGNVYRRAGAARTKLSPQRRKVLNALEPPMTYTEWAESSGVPSTTFKRAIKYLTEQGYVHQGDDGTYSRAEGQGPQGPFKDHGPSGPEHEEGPPLSCAYRRKVVPTAGPTLTGPQFPKDPNVCVDCGAPAADPLSGRVNRCVACAVKAGNRATEEMRREREAEA